MEPFGANGYHTLQKISGCSLSGVHFESPRGCYLSLHQVQDISFGEVITVHCKNCKCCQMSPSSFSFFFGGVVLCHLPFVFFNFKLIILSVFFISMVILSVFFNFNLIVFSEFHLYHHHLCRRAHPGPCFHFHG